MGDNEQKQPARLAPACKRQEMQVQKPLAPALVLSGLEILLKHCHLISFCLPLCDESAVSVSYQLKDVN